MVSVKLLCFKILWLSIASFISFCWEWLKSYACTLLALYWCGMVSNIVTIAIVRCESIEIRYVQILPDNYGPVCDHIFQIKTYWQLILTLSALHLSVFSCLARCNYQNWSSWFRPQSCMHGVFFMTRGHRCRRDIILYGMVDRYCRDYQTGSCWSVYLMYEVSWPVTEYKSSAVVC